MYGLGALLYALLVAHPAACGESLAEVLAQIVSEEPWPSPRRARPEIPAELEAVCRKCLAKDPACRYESAEEVAAALSGIAGTGVRRAGRKTKSDPPRQTRLQKLAVPAALGAIFAGILAAVSWAPWSPRAEAPIAPATPPVAVDEVEVTWAIDLYRGGRRQDCRELIEAPVTGDKLRLRLVFSRPAHAFLFWIDGMGNVDQLHPEAGQPQQAIDELTFPQDDRLAVPVTGKPGTEVCVLVLRPKPWPDEVDMAGVLRPPSGFPPLQQNVVLVYGAAVTGPSQMNLDSPRTSDLDFPPPEADAYLHREYRAGWTL